MQFDSADAVNYLNNGLWDDIITHEMMHVLGFGTLWNYGANPLVPTAGQYIGKRRTGRLSGRRSPRCDLHTGPDQRRRRNRRRALVRVGARQRIDDPLHQRLQLPVELQCDVAGRSRLQRPAATLAGKSRRLRRGHAGTAPTVAGGCRVSPDLRLSFKAAMLERARLEGTSLLTFKLGLLDCGKPPPRAEAGTHSIRDHVAARYWVPALRLVDL